MATGKALIAAAAANRAPPRIGLFAKVSHRPASTMASNAMLGWPRSNMSKMQGRRSTDGATRAHQGRRSSSPARRALRPRQAHQAAMFAATRLAYIGARPTGP